MIYGSVSLIGICVLLIANKIIPEMSIFVSLLLFLPVIWFVHFGIRCPRCNENLSYAVFSVGNPFSVSKKIKYCLYCGVAFDTELGPNEQNS